MDKIFWLDPYQTQLQTYVTAVDNDWVLLDKTIAFSFSGGQESDHGTIQGYPIKNSKIAGQDIWYQLADNHHLKVGDYVEMSIDWERRYALMRLHFAAELILEIVYKHFHLEKIGAHIAQDKARIDFKCASNISQFFPQILDIYHDIISCDLPITKDYLDQSTQRRYWEITGFAKVPCGGTHVKKTGEVGPISLKRKNIGKGKERIEIMLC